MRHPQPLRRRLQRGQHDATSSTSGADPASAGRPARRSPRWHSAASSRSPSACSPPPAARSPRCPHHRRPATPPGPAAPTPPASTATGSRDQHHTVARRAPPHPQSTTCIMIPQGNVTYLAQHLGGCIGDPGALGTTVGRPAPPATEGRTAAVPRERKPDHRKRGNGGATWPALDRGPAGSSG